MPLATFFKEVEKGAMELTKVIVKGSFSDYLNGREVEGKVLDIIEASSLTPGQHVMVFKDAIASESNISVPKNQQSHYIGIEGTITEIVPSKNQKHLHLKVVKA